VTEPGTVTVHLTGPFLARRDATELTHAELDGRQARLAFALVVHAGVQPVSRDRLADVLWPDGPPATWAPALRTIMSKVRLALSRLLPEAGDVLVHTGDGYRLQLPDGVELVVDVELALAGVDAATAAVAAADAAEGARLATQARVVLSRQFLPGEEGPWVEEVRRELHDARVRALEVLARARIDLDQPALAAAAASEAVRLEPYRESAYRLLIASQASGGNRAEALRTYERCRRLLAEELGVDPAPETEALYLTLLGDEPEPRARVVAPGEWRMVGRDQQLAALEHLLGKAAAGSGSVVLITGEPGIGKTRLARELAARAPRHGAAVLWGTCREPEWSAPYGPLVDLLPDLANLVPAEMVDRLGRLLAGGGEAVAETEVFAVREDLRRAVLVAAAGAPVVLVIDDLQWADDGTLAALRHLTPSVPRARFLVLLARRDGDAASRPGVAAAVSALSREPGVTRIGLAPLDAGSVSDLVESTVQDAPDWLGPSIATETGGNPFFVQATLAHLIETAAIERARAGDIDPSDLLTDVPDVLRDIVGRRLESVTPPCRELLRSASMFEGPFLLADAAVAAGLAETAALDALDEALAARVLVDFERGDATDAYQFGHAIVRHTIAGGLSASRRARLHRRVAEAIDARTAGAPSVSEARELAGQYRASASLPGAIRGVEHAVRAAEHAASTGAFDTAASLFAIALELLPSDAPTRVELSSRHALSLLRSTRYDEGAALALDAADALIARTGARAAAALLAEAAWAAEMAGGSTTAFALAAAGMPLVAAGPRDDVWARLTILDLRRREADEPSPVGMPLDPPERREAARILHADDRFRADLAWAVWEDRAEILERGFDDMHALTFWAGRYREALSSWQRAAAAAEARGLVSEAVNDWSGAARCAVALGHFADAGSMIERAEDLARRIDLRGSFVLQLLAAHDDLVHARDDGYDELWASSRRLTSERLDRAQRWAEATWFASGARAFALEGRADDARTFLDAVMAVLPSVPRWIVSSNRVVSDAVAAMWVLGDARHLVIAEDAVRTKLLGPDFRCPMHDPRLAMARCAALGGRVDEAREWLGAARAVCDEDGLGPLRAIVDHDEAVLLTRDGDRAGARERAAEAADRAAALGMGGWLRRAEGLAAG
jgi:DNA-binding SARP family transcriptional activator